MNHIAEEIKSFLGSASLDEGEFLEHYGTPQSPDGSRGSGRYRLGSGEDPNQHGGDLLTRIEKLQKEGLSETEIAKAFGVSTTQLRTQKSRAIAERKNNIYAKVLNLKDDGYNNSEIARMLGYENESSIRSILNQDAKKRRDKAQNTADILRKELETKNMIDVGDGVERELGNISKEKLKQALSILADEGYPTWAASVPQATNPGQQTNLQVLCHPGTTQKEVYDAVKTGGIDSVQDYISRDGGDTYEKPFKYPASMDSNRLKVRYADETDSDGVTGIQKDGVIEIRRGVKDLDLGSNNYAQVRILVDGTHYLKGMAVYSDDMPDGVDVVFNTNKAAGTPALGPKNDTVLKPIKKDPENPFGSSIKEHGGQSTWIDENGESHLSLINKKSAEGDWSDWADRVPSQFLAKQPQKLIKRQIDISLAERVAQFNEINELTNPTVKKTLLEEFASDCDSNAVHLYAAALPRQKYHVILPLNNISDNEVYAPRYENGEKIALIRYPHGGTFEIPILTVNNNNPLANKIIGRTSIDAVGINSNVAARLSGADFDGDTVMAIPTGKGGINIKSTAPLKGLENFDPKERYPYHEGMKVMSARQKQIEMGKASNLIMDMTLKGASEEEMAKAVRHSMVVIDAEKHRLDYRQSEIDNDIASLKRRYQGHITEDGRYSEAASTLLTRAKNEVTVDKRQGSGVIDKETGKLSYKVADKLYYYDRYTEDGNGHKKGELKLDKSGNPKLIKRTQKSTQMAETDDAFNLVSDMNTAAEQYYAMYANKLKAMANEARKIMVNTKDIKYNPSAKAVYNNEVETLMSKLNISLSNQPRERMAQLIARSEIEAKVQANPDMTKEEKKKMSGKALINARLKVSAKRHPIEITDKEWQAIQAGALSANRLKEILRYADKDKVKQYSMPRESRKLTTSQVSRIKAMEANGRTLAEIAASLGVSTSTVTKYLNA